MQKIIEPVKSTTNYEPSVSADDYDTFTIMRGRDSNLWINLNLNKNSIVRWRKICIVKKNGYFKLNFGLLMNIKRKLDQSKTNFEMIRIATLNVKQKLLVGDSLVYDLPGFGEGSYTIYNYSNSAIASKRIDLTHESLSMLHFSYCKNINVDYGVFMFRDSYSLLEMATFLIHILKELIKNESDPLVLQKLNRTLDHEITKIDQKAPNCPSMFGDLDIGKIITNVGNSDYGISYPIDLFQEIISNIPQGNKCMTSPNIPKPIVSPNVSPNISPNVSPSDDLCARLKDEFIQKFGSDYVLSTYTSNGYGDGQFPVIVNRENDTVIQLDAFLTNIFATVVEIVQHKIIGYNIKHDKEINI